MQRGLVLLKNHLELFNRRYAFHMRTWQLDGVGVTPHQPQASGKVSSPLRIMLQTSGISEKVRGAGMTGIGNEGSIWGGEFWRWKIGCSCWCWCWWFCHQ